jgi:sugar lactone lactonase YvrE
MLDRRGAGAIAAAVVVGALATAPVPAWAAPAPVPGPTVVAGTGAAGFSGDGGAATQAQLRNPTGVGVAPDGTVYIADSGNLRIRAVAPDGTISTVAGTGTISVSPTPVPPGGAAATAAELSPDGLAVGRDGKVRVADVRRFQTLTLSDGRITVLAGTGVRGFSGDGGPATAARLGGMLQPCGVAIAPDGTVYVVDADNRRIRAVSADGVIRTVAGSGGSDNRAAGGLAEDIAIPGVSGIAVDDEGTLWITYGGVLARVRDGRLSTVVRTDDRWTTDATPSWPPALDSGEFTLNADTVAAGRDGVYILQSLQQVLRFNRDGTVDTVARLPDGPLKVAQQATIGPDGAMYLTDTDGNRVLRFPPSPHVPRSDPGESDGTPWLPVTGVAVLLVVAGAAGWFVLRRRSR